MDYSNLTKRIINALFINGEEMSFKSLSDTLKISKDDIKNDLVNVRNALQLIGLQLIEVNENIAITNGEEGFEILESIHSLEVEADLSPAQLQVLTIIAYLPDLSIQDISFIRGVQSNQSVRSLTTRGLIERDGEKLKLTIEALKQLGITSIDKLPEYESINKGFKEKLGEALNG
jgi:segregation and condensation protein B